MERLSPEILPALDGLAKPNYSRAVVKPGIVHLGIGAFHRAHQAYYTDALMNLAGGDWGIIGCSLRSSTVAEQLNPQSGLYTLVEKSESLSSRVIGAVQQVLVAPENPQAVIDAMALPTVKVISLTVTEKGYCHHPASGTLNTEHPDIVHDLQNPHAPKSAPGFIVAALAARFKKGTGPVTVLSCDNLPNNGAVTRAVVVALAEQIDSELASWIKANITFPATMIDRIVPATTETDISELAKSFGYQDEGLVVAEPFTQWVIEDDFCSEKPAWDKVGALFVKDVDSFETMKLRLLNGSHSLLAYSGYLGGYKTISQVMQDNDYVQLAKQFMKLAASTLKAPEGFNVDDYQAQLIARFTNPGLQHKTWQIAMDGSQKVPQRWLNTLRGLIATGAPTALFGFALACWIRFVSGVDEQGQPIEISDPLASTFKKLHDEHANDSDALIAAFFSQQAIFGNDLNSTQLVALVQSHYRNLNAKGVRACLAKLVSE